MSKDNSSSGIGFLSLLAVLFIGLKLTNYIDWSWWYVTLPLWGGLAIAMVMVIIWGGVMLFAYISKVNNKSTIKNSPNSIVTNNIKAPKSRFQQRLDAALK